MWCVCLQEEDDKDDKGKAIKVYKCRAAVGTSPWKIIDIANAPCKDSTKFVTCARLEKFIEYTKAANTLNVKQQ